MPTLAPQREAPRSAHGLTPQVLATGACWAMVAMLVAWSLFTGVSTGLLAVLCWGALLLIFWGHPRLAFITWMLSLLMLPIWVSAELFSLTVPAHCVVAITAVAATIGRSGMRFTKFDAYFALFLAACLAAVALGGSTPESWAQIVVRWGIPFLAARVLVSATGTRFAVDAIAALLGLVGGLAVLELLLTWHPFVGWTTSSPEFDIWHTIQIRSGVDRSEWAFGHSIALGGSLALSIPFILRSSYKTWLRAALLMCVGIGTLATSSRGAVVAAGFTVAICLLYVMKKRIMRTAALAMTMSAILLASSSLIPVLETWARGSSGEARGSFEHRGALYSSAKLEWFGSSSIYSGANSTSLDSAILQIGLGFGWIVLALALFPLALSAVRLITGRASTAEIAIVGQTPLFASVALVTQYAGLVFLVIGIAVQMYISEKDTKSASELHNVGDSQPLTRRHTRSTPDTHTLVH